MKNTEHKIRTNWDDISKGFRRDYTYLTDEDLRYEEGEENDLLRRLEKRLDMPPEAIEEYIDKYPISEDRRSRNTGE